MTAVLLIGLVAVIAVLVCGALRQAAVGWPLITGIALVYLVIPRFLDDPPNRLPSLFPYVWLPAFLVQVALAGHVLVFRRLRAPQAAHGRR
jgi:hypothetical protein